LRAIDFIVIFLAGKKRKKAGKFPAFFCEPSGYFWKIFWTIVLFNLSFRLLSSADGFGTGTKLNVPDFVGCLRFTEPFLSPHLDKLTTQIV